MMLRVRGTVRLDPVPHAQDEQILSNCASRMQKGKWQLFLTNAQPQ